MMVTGLQLPVQASPLDGLLTKSALKDSGTTRPLSFGELLSVREKQLQQEQELNAALAAVTMAAMRTSSVTMALLKPEVTEELYKVDTQPALKKGLPLQVSSQTLLGSMASSVVQDYETALAGAYKEQNTHQSQASDVWRAAPLQDSGVIAETTVSSESMDLSRDVKTAIAKSNVSGQAVQTEIRHTFAAPNAVEDRANPLEVENPGMDVAASRGGARKVEVHPRSVPSATPIGQEITSSTMKTDSGTTSVAAQTSVRSPSVTQVVRATETLGLKAPVNTPISSGVGKVFTRSVPHEKNITGLLRTPELDATASQTTSDLQKAVTDAEFDGDQTVDHVIEETTGDEGSFSPNRETDLASHQPSFFVPIEADVGQEAISVDAAIDAQPRRDHVLDTEMTAVNAGVHEFENQNTVPAQETDIRSSQVVSRPVVAQAGFDWQKVNAETSTAFADEIYAREPGTRNTEIRVGVSGENSDNSGPAQDETNLQNITIDAIKVPAPAEEKQQTASDSFEMGEENPQNLVNVAATRQGIGLTYAALEKPASSTGAFDEDPQPAIYGFESAVDTTTDGEIHNGSQNNDQADSEMFEPSGLHGSADAGSKFSNVEVKRPTRVTEEPASSVEGIQPDLEKPAADVSPKFNIQNGTEVLKTQFTSPAGETSIPADQPEFDAVSAVPQEIRQQKVRSGTEVVNSQFNDDVALNRGVSARSGIAGKNKEAAHATKGLQATTVGTETDVWQYRTVESQAKSLALENENVERKTVAFEPLSNTPQGAFTSPVVTVLHTNTNSQAGHIIAQAVISEVSLRTLKSDLPDAAPFYTDVDLEERPATSNEMEVEPSNHTSDHPVSFSAPSSVMNTASARTKVIDHSAAQTITSLNLPEDVGITVRNAAVHLDSGSKMEMIEDQTDNRAEFVSVKADQQIAATPFQIEVDLGKPAADHQIVEKYMAAHESAEVTRNVSTTSVASPQEFTRSEAQPVKAPATVQAPLSDGAVGSNQGLEAYQIISSQEPKATIHEAALPMSSAESQEIPASTRPHYSPKADSGKQAVKADPIVENEEKILFEEQRPEPKEGIESSSFTPNSIKESVMPGTFEKTPIVSVNHHAVEFVQQVIRQWNGKLNGGPSSMHLQLNPESLGAIDVEVVRDVQGVSVTFIAEQSSTGKLLETQLGQLRQSLVDSGVQLSGLYIGQQNHLGQEGGFRHQNSDFAQQAPQEVFQSKSNPEESSHVERIAGQTSEVDYLI